ncbi:hypothetical protein COY95_00210 [Candidatus Woesearchaeota archaeon CG_4_10_14_0_8_um_filter_47_5]|nr:MAG: hypothetical protein COY95_00210 [Candidatus Woesearchaeota archaeon CG_4_10_14_0_8_um_filter_47_5]
MGVTGIFFDDYSKDYHGAGAGGCGLSSSSYASQWTEAQTEAQMADALMYTHAAGLKAFVNTWNWGESTQGTSLGKHLESGDVILAESFITYQGSLYDLPGKFDERLTYKQNENLWTPGVQFACLSTSKPNVNPAQAGAFDDSTYYDVAVAGAAAFGCDYVGITDNYHSGSNPQTLEPIHVPKNLAGIAFTEELEGTGGYYARKHTTGTLTLTLTPGAAGYNPSS